MENNKLTAKTLDGLAVAEKIKNYLIPRIENLPDPPHLAVCLVGEDPASKVYVARKQKMCNEIGIKSTLCQIPSSVKQSELINVISKLSDDVEIDGILVQLPLPVHINQCKVLSSIDSKKDVDCFNPYNCGLLMHGEPEFMPCTPIAILEILNHYEIKVKGQHIVIINRSLTVGQPLASMLSQKWIYGNATVTLVHEHTSDLKAISKEADIIISAVGKGHDKFVLTGDMVKKGATVIDVGINVINGKIVGDADPSVKDVAGYLTPVPGGVGPVVIATLMRNTVEAAEKFYAS